MLAAAITEAAVFESMKAELLRQFGGGFAVICGHRLVGVFPSMEAAMAETGRAFDAGALPPGAPILISEIAETVTVRVLASPQPRTALAAAPP